MDVALAAFAFAPALAIGSFLNVVAARVPLRRSVVSGRSACMGCGQGIAWYDNVPVVSYLALRGRCRSCGTRITPLYPAVELATALLVAACFLVFGLSSEAAVAALFCVALVTLSASDLRHRLVPNVIVLPAAAVVLAAQTALDPSVEWAAGALGASPFPFLAVPPPPKGVGGGGARKMAIPFAPFLSLGGVVALFAGERILDWYLTLL